MFAGLAGAPTLAPPALGLLTFDPKGVELDLASRSLPAVPLTKAHSPVHLETLIPLLEVYPRKNNTLYLEAGFRDGFRIPYEGSRFSTHSLCQQRFCSVLFNTF